MSTTCAHLDTRHRRMIVALNDASLDLVKTTMVAELFRLTSLSFELEFFDLNGRLEGLLANAQDGYTGPSDVRQKLREMSAALLVESRDPLRGL